MKLFSLLLFSLFAFTGICQNAVSTCYFGTVGIDFRTDPPSVLNNSVMDGRESPASICDNAGNILFYTNGGTSPVSSVIGAIWNKQHQIMENGILEDSAGCISSFSGAIIIPAPDDGLKQKNDLYYVLTRDCIESSFAAPYYNSGLTYSMVDMSQNNGLGKVIEKYQSIVPYSVVGGHKSNHEPVAAILQSNNVDYWIFSYRNDSIYRISLTKNGFENFSAIDTAEGKITISPARDFLVAGNQLYELDVMTGNLSFTTSFGNTNFGQNIAFSSNGTHLYTIENNVLYQYELNAPNFLASKLQISTLGISYKLFLAPNGRIYLFEKNANQLAGVITCPDKSGTACGFNMNSLSLNGGNTGSQFTNLMAHYLYQSGASCLVGIEEEEIVRTSISIYPNPTHGMLQISLEAETSYYVKLLSLSGSILEKSPLFQRRGTLDLTDYPKGVYLLKIISDQFTLHRKIMLN